MSANAATELAVWRYRRTELEDDATEVDLAVMMLAESNVGQEEFDALFLADDQLEAAMVNPTGDV